LLTPEALPLRPRSMAPASRTTVRLSRARLTAAYTRQRSRSLKESHASANTTCGSSPPCALCTVPAKASPTSPASPDQYRLVGHALPVGVLHEEPVALALLARDLHPHVHRHDAAGLPVEDRLTVIGAPVHPAVPETELSAALGAERPAPGPRRIEDVTEPVVQRPYAQRALPRRRQHPDVVRPHALRQQPPPLGPVRASLTPGARIVNGARPLPGQAPSTVGAHATGTDFGVNPAARSPDASTGPRSWRQL